MGKTNTNNTSLAYAIETTPGVLPGAPSWKLIGPNDITDMGAEYSKVSRSPISKDQQRSKGSIVDLDSGFEFETDVTMEHVNDFAEGYMRSVAKGSAKIFPTAVTTTAYTVPTMGASIPQNLLVIARGFANAVNNGLKVVDTGGTTTSVPITGGGMVAETTAPPPTGSQNATIEVCGVRGASGDIQINASGHLIATALNFTTLGITAGQFVKIGGALTANQFTNTVNNGYARVLSVAAGVITLDKRNATFVTDTGTGKLIDVYFSRFIRNVTVDSADYTERYYQFEAAFENLGVSAGTDEYMYAKGNLANEWTLNFPLADKATMSCNFMGTDTLPPSTTRATNAATATVQAQQVLMSTTADFARLRLVEIDETGISTDFKSLSLTVRNNVNAAKKLGQLGAVGMNVGNFEADVAISAMFTSSTVLTRVRDNKTVTLDFGLRNDDGGFVVDLPEVTIASGKLGFPRNEQVTIDIPLVAHRSVQFGYTMSFSIFPYLPPIV